VRIVFIILLVILAALIGGIYGALYDQITYTVSNEFFTKRFEQAGIVDTGLIRWEVAKIGFIKTWSVGFWLGLFLSLGGLLHEDNRKMFYVTLQAFFIALGTAFIFGIIAFFFADTSIDVVVENTVTDKKSFNKVLCMNNYSYVGGIIGMFLGLGWQVLKTRFNKKK
jgi:hypothetical protein